MTAPLPPFSGDLPTCTECGAVGASTQYRSFGQCTHATGTEDVLGTEPNGRLHRQCPACGHQWDEAVVPLIRTETIHIAPDPSRLTKAIRDVRRHGFGSVR
ncbi:MULTISPECIES: hypothetical protein [Streptomyces]